MGRGRGTETVVSQSLHVPSRESFLRLRYLEIIHAILQTGSVTEAARLLGMGVPTSVEAMLVQAESELGMQLFVREGQGLTPTPEVLALLPDIREIFRRIDRVNDSATALAHGRRGGITIGGALALCNGYLVDAVARFRQRFPQVDVVLHALRTAEVVERVMAREVDLGLCYGPVANSALSVEVIASRDLVCVLPESHPLASRPRLTAADLAGETLISYVPGDRLRAKIDALFRDQDQPPKFALTVTQTVTALGLVQAGAGIAVVEPFFLDSMRPQGLVSRAVAPTEALTVEAVTRADGPVQAALVAEFMAILREVARLAP